MVWETEGVGTIKFQVGKSSWFVWIKAGLSDV
jgi:hypothetical protein